MILTDDFYKLIAEKESDIIYTVSLDSKIRFLNKSVEKIFETSIEEIEKNRFDHLMLPKDKELAKRLWNERLEGKSSVFEHGFITPNGKLVYLECSASPIFDKDGTTIIGSLGIARNITERKLQEKELRESQEQLEETIKLKDKFLSIIAHDLRDPFNILIGYSSLILSNLEKDSCDNLKQYVQAINTSSKNAFNLLNNIINWSKSQTNKIVYSPHKMNIAILFDQICNELEYAANAKNITLINKLNYPIEVSVDENMLSSVLRNLIFNAIKFSYRDSNITIELKEENYRYIINITDNGIGIKEEDIHKLFLPKPKTISAGTNHESGTGLGLIICKEFIHKWGGDIWVKSTYEKGSSFSFSLPK